MRRFVAVILAIVAILAICLLALRLTHPLPSLEGRTESRALPPSDRTLLGRLTKSSGASAVGSGASGVWPLADGREAFAARVILARAAEATIDAQYYIWQADTTGWLLLDELRAAAERGVRVRLLVDDNGIAGLDGALAALDALPTAQVRLFNPFMFRDPKALSYLFDFRRLNRRMHNKSMTVDGIATIVGGRNIGDIYFSYGQDTHYFDLDLLAMGSAATDVSENFDKYWSSASAYPVALVLEPDSGGLEILRSEAADAGKSMAASPYLQAIAESTLMRDLQSGAPKLEWARVTLLSDEPEKALGKSGRDELLISRLLEIEKPAEQLDLVSAYFIPGQEGTELLGGLARDGVRVRTLTNSLEATDVAPVHGAYARYRPELLEAGVELLELRANAGIRRDFKLSELLTGSASSLHAKTFAIDSRRIFIGSFNFDPRSASLNTEMGFLIESPEIARRLHAALDKPDFAYSLRRTRDDGIEWIANGPDGNETVYTADPNSGVLTRAFVRVIGWLPVEWML